LTKQNKNRMQIGVGAAVFWPLVAGDEAYDERHRSALLFLASSECDAAEVATVSLRRLYRVFNARSSKMESKWHS
jgi:hypothetical protein